MLDAHSHFLPRIDDGAKNTEMSVQMLKESYAQGVRTMIATPHFYVDSHSSADSFIKKRQASYERLLEVLGEDKEIPEIILGSEVYFFKGMAGYEGLEKLCIGQSSYLLLEMPFEQWNSRIIREVEDMIYNRKLNIIIAHLERYLSFQKDYQYAQQLLELGVMVQINAESIIGFFTRRKMLGLIKNKVVHLVGSDCHNLTNRSPNLEAAYKIIEKKIGKEAVLYLKDRSSSFLQKID